MNLYQVVLGAAELTKQNRHITLALHLDTLVSSLYSEAAMWPAYSNLFFFFLSFFSLELIDSKQEALFNFL